MQRILLAAILALGMSVGTPAVAQPAHAWEIGPVIRGKNYSWGMPLTLQAGRAGDWFEFPAPHAGVGHVHYVTTPTAPLVGASRIVLRYRIEAVRGTRFVPQEHPDLHAMVSIFFQRRGDSWSAKRHEHHRWYAPQHTMRKLAPGEYQISVSLGDPGWISVRGRPASENPEMFAQALADTRRIGFVFGSTQARGHGVFATAPARFTVLDFRVI